MFAKVLVANRGEIARRVIRTLHRLGIRSVAIYVAADRDAPHVGEATEAVAVTSYLDIEAVIAAGTQVAADALHPGYGFLSENPALASACQTAGITFVGPPPEVSALVGDKLRAKALAHAAGLPIVPSFSETEAEAAAGAASTAYPLLVKAAAGGGGRGMRVVTRAEDLAAALASARREALAGFGDERVFIERFLPRARHLEVQVIADAHGTVLHLGERECSLQRRHQKVIEESPSPAVSAALRERLGAEAVAFSRAGGYVNAGTVEFIADCDDPAEHYFLEMNARLQVEHPVTELVTGLDLVELQLRVAAGAPLGLAQHQVRRRGHAIEARINAEDAARDFLPSAGRVLVYHEPHDARIDAAIEPGSHVDASFDSLLAKVIVHGENRTVALAKLDQALRDTAILGLTTTAGYVRWLIATDEVSHGRIDTGLIERLLPWAPGPTDEDVARAAALITQARCAEQAGDDPFARCDGWRLGGRRASSWWRFAVAAHPPVEIELEPAAAPPLRRSRPDSFIVGEPGAHQEWFYAVDGEQIWLGSAGLSWAVHPSLVDEAEQTETTGALRAPMPGQVLLVGAAVGQEVRTGDPLVVLESMKMELVMTAPMDGRVAELNVVAGDQVSVDHPLARVEAVT